MSRGCAPPIAYTTAPPATLGVGAPRSRQGIVTESRNTPHPPAGCTGMPLGVALPLQNRIDTTVQLAREAHEAGPRSAWFGQAFAYDSPMLAAAVYEGVGIKTVRGKVVTAFTIDMQKKKSHVVGGKLGSGRGI